MSLPDSRPKTRRVVRIAVAALSLALFWPCPPALGDSPIAEVTVAFDKPLRPWDGFGANYVEVRHTRDYTVWPQDYSGFKYLSEAERDEIVDLVFGDNGLKVSIVKMFLDPLHQRTREAVARDAGQSPDFDHRTTTQQMRYFVRKGLQKTRARGENLQILAGLYAAPGWAIRQGPWGRDLIPERESDLADYMVSWVKYLKEEERLPVRYLSLHNEEAGRDSWDSNGYPKQDVMSSRLDRALSWPKEQVVRFLGLLRAKLDAQGLHDVGLTPGETRNWGFFEDQGIPDALASDPNAMKRLRLITSHGFMRSEPGRSSFQPADYRGDGIARLRATNPNLHAWTTSCKLDGFAKDVADIGYMEQMRLQIYETKVNAIIPWSTIHCDWESDRVMDGDFKKSGNVNSPIRIVRTSNASGYYEIRKGYYFYKQLTRAGRPGMQVADVMSSNRDIRAIAFAGGDSDNTDSFILFNVSDADRSVRVSIRGAGARTFSRYLTGEADAGDGDYEFLGTADADDGVMMCALPAKTSVAFYGVRRGGVRNRSETAVPRKR